MDEDKKTGENPGTSTVNEINKSMSMDDYFNESKKRCQKLKKMTEELKVIGKEYSDAANAVRARRMSLYMKDLKSKPRFKSTVKLGKNQYKVTKKTLDTMSKLLEESTKATDLESDSDNFDILHASPAELELNSVKRFKRLEELLEVTKKMKEIITVNKNTEQIT